MQDERAVEDAVILCGGLGTRLRAVLEGRPKSLAPVRGRPFLEWLVLALARQGVRRVVLASGYLDEQLRQHFGRERFGVEILHSTESEPLGTGGALQLAASLVRPPTLAVLNGDTFCRFDLARMANFHQAHDAAATIWLAPAEDRERFGSVEVDAEGRVVAFHEKAERGEGCVNAGIYLIERDVVRGIRGRSSLERDVFPGLVGKGLYAITGSSGLVDIGTPDALAQAEYALVEEFDELERFA